MRGVVVWRANFVTHYGPRSVSPARNETAASRIRFSGRSPAPHAGSCSPAAAAPVLGIRAKRRLSIRNSSHAGLDLQALDSLPERVGADAEITRQQREHQRPPEAALPQRHRPTGSRQEQARGGRRQPQQQSTPHPRMEDPRGGVRRNGCDGRLKTQCPQTSRRRQLGAAPFRRPRRDPREGRPSARGPQGADPMRTDPAAPAPGRPCLVPPHSMATVRIPAEGGECDRVAGKMPPV